MTSIQKGQCDRCKHWRPTLLGTGTCAAFPGGIPFDVWTNQIDHTEPIEGDRGVQFEPREADQSLELEPY